MNHTHRAASRRLALVVSSVAVTMTMCLGGMPHAAADPYDTDDAGQMSTAESGTYESYDAGVDDSGPDAGGTVDSAPAPADPAVDETPAPIEQTPEAPDADPEPAPHEQPAAPAPAPDPDPAPAPDAPPADDSAPAEAQEAQEVQNAEVAAVPQSDVDAADATAPVELPAEPASPAQIDQLTQSLTAFTGTSTMTSSSWSSTVTQWNSAWVGYDTYYRPVFTNPYRDTLTLIYSYGNVVHVVDVAPLQRGVIAVPTPGTYSFTAVTRTDAEQIATVSTGSFSGGGYVPAAGQQPPRKPTEPTTYRNVLVALRYTTTASQPFRVKALTDLGDDPAAGARRVLLDSATPAWGRWTTAAHGERLFEITKSQQLPGLTAPAQGPLPGYDVRMTSSEATAADSWVTPAAIAAAGCGVLAVAAVGGAVLAGRRRRED